MTRPSDDLEALIGELNSSAERLDAGERDARLDAWVRQVMANRGSDLLLVSGSKPMMRVDGSLRAIGSSPLSDQDVEDAILPLIPAPGRAEYLRIKIVDASLRLPGSARLRVNLHHERGRPAAAIRILPTEVPQLSKLGLPAEVENLTRLGAGLVLIGGATGSGKTTTVAALVDAINRRDRKHIVTVEDPIEYEHPNHQGLVEQVEIGIDAPDFPTALRAAVRQAPDILVIGEMRDHESMRIALTAAETGHLVFSTLHTTDVAATVGRICDSFPNERQNTIRQELAWALAAVMTQTLIPGPSGGRFPAAELLMLSYGARQHIRKNALQHLYQEITLTRRQGSFTLEESLARLVKQGHIPASEAIVRARHPEEMESLLR
ncbi:MAG: type IV pilus twitching motility protein PilT [Acidimicrobiia bacterium]